MNGVSSRAATFQVTRKGIDLPARPTYTSDARRSLLTHCFIWTYRCRSVILYRTGCMEAFDELPSQHERRDATYRSPCQISQHCAQCPHAIAEHPAEGHI